MNILALGSHPDDIEYMCAGTLLRYREQGHKIFIALTTSGNIGSNVHGSRAEIAALREKEQLAAAALLGAEVRFMRYDDEGLLDTCETRRSVLNAMRWANADVILTNYPGDQSTDHAVTGALVSKMMLSLPGKLVPSDEPALTKRPSLFYWDTASGIGFHPEVYVDITGVIERKLQALAEHRSQACWMGVFMKDEFVDNCRVLSRFRGVQAGYAYAEGFRAFRIHGFMPDFKLLP